MQFSPWYNTWIQCCINTIIIHIAHGRDQLVYYDTWVGRLQRKPHEAASTGWNNSVEQIRNAYIPIYFLNKIWLIIPLLLKYNNQQQVYMILFKLNTRVALL